MASYVITGNAIVITSALKSEDIKLLTKTNPKALKLFDGDKNEIFALSVGAKENISKYGVVFNKSNAAGYAQMTLKDDAAANAAEAKKTFVDSYTGTILNLNKLEDSASEAIDEAKVDMTTAESAIQVVE